MEDINQKGLTVIEIVVVLAIIAILTTLSAFAVLGARVKVRDAKRVSDITQIQSVLEDYFIQNNVYPAGENLSLGDAAKSVCLSSAGFSVNCSGDEKVFMQIVPAEPEKGLKGEVKCGDAQTSAYCYSAVPDGSGYQIGFEMERGILERNIVKGANCAVPEGIKQGTCQ